MKMLKEILKWVGISLGILVLVWMAITTLVLIFWMLFEAWKNYFIPYIQSLF